MTPLLNTLLFSPLLLLTLDIQDLTEACSCLPAHPQTQICRSDIVIHATIWSKEEIGWGMFKGFEKAKDVQYVFTPLTSAVCGVTLEEGAKKKNQYLLSGVNVTRWKSFYLCDFIKPWNDLTNSQKNNLREKYKRGCDCKITACQEEPCPIATPNECLWTDWLKEQTVYGHQANNCACSDGTCSWH
ncbi:hypothetical protein E2320_015079 [Naja naja]|nr:hypothetical protein E2320_015079 [Naja naja]